MYITIRAGYTMTIKKIRQHKNSTIRQQIFTYLIHVRKEIFFIETRFFTVSSSLQGHYHSMHSHSAFSLQGLCRVFFDIPHMSWSAQCSILPSESATNSGLPYKSC